MIHKNYYIIEKSGHRKIDVPTTGYSENMNCYTGFFFILLHDISFLKLFGTNVEAFSTAGVV